MILITSLLVLAQQAPPLIPPETSNPYMVMGYAVVLLITGGLIGFLVNRSRRLRQEMALLLDLDKDKPQ